MRRRLTPLYLLVPACVFLTFAFRSTPSSGLPATGARQTFGPADWSGGHKYVPGEVLVRFKPGVSPRGMLYSHAKAGGMLKRKFTSVDRLNLVELASGISVRTALQRYKRDPNVLYAEPDYIVHPFALPNDPLFSQQWGLLNFGQDGGTSGADINASQAWTLTTGSPKVVVAVIDSGIDYTHPDLAPNVWSNPAAFSQTVDGTNISCAAGTHGFNAVASTCDPMDDFGHGTHVSGIIGAAGNNNLGVSGVNWNVQLLACKFIDANGDGTTDAAVTCLDYIKALKDQGVNLVATNNSWGGEYDSSALDDAIASLETDGILFVAAAGNSFNDNDISPTYPANVFLPNIISVAATTRFDQLAGFSDVRTLFSPSGSAGRRNSQHAAGRPVPDGVGNLHVRPVRDGSGSASGGPGLDPRLAGD